MNTHRAKEHCLPSQRLAFIQAVRRSRSFLKYWLPVLAWMFLIFSASSDTLSSQRTSRIIGPLLRWLKPDISEETLYRVQYAVRKAAHMAEYAVLAVLMWRAWRQPVKGDPRPWLWREAGLVLVGCLIYAASDEVHQAFVPSREARIGDVVFDATGAALGLLAWWLLGCWRKVW